MEMKFNTNEFTGLLRDEIQKTLKFSAAQTMTQTAFDVRREVQRKLPQWLNIKRAFLKQSVVVDRANYRDAKPFSVVGFLERARLVELLEEGGKRRPFSSRNIAVPVGAANKAGKVTKSKRPRQLLARDDTFISTINGVDGIWQRRKGRGKAVRLTLMYAFKETTDYDEGQIRFFATADKVVPRSFGSRFPKNVKANFRKNIERKRLKGLL